MNLLETILIGTIFGVIGGILAVALINWFKTWRLKTSAFNEIESYKDKMMYQTVNGKDVPFLPFLRQEREKFIQMKGGKRFFKKKNDENKLKTEQPATTQYASAYGDTTATNDTTHSSSGRITPTKKETSYWDFH